VDADLVIIGSGIGGATLAAALAPSGLRIVVVERGEHLRPCPEARDEVAIFRRGHFAWRERWTGPDGMPFVAACHYHVGGASKFYGAVMYRFREGDFRPRAQLRGTTPGWPLSYADMEPWYGRAEALFRVRGTAGEDPTEPPRSTPYGWPAVPDEPAMARVRERLRRAGVHPASLPLAIDIKAWLAGGMTGWDAFPNTGEGKIDAETGPLREALRHPNVTLLPGTEAIGLETDAAGARVVAAVLRGENGGRRLAARGFAVAAGAIQTAALLLRSAGATHPRGLANGSDQVGRNFMNHNSSAMLAIDPRTTNSSVYQKTLSFNDFYDRDEATGAPLGNVQSLGRITGPILRANLPWLPAPLARLFARHAFGWFLQSEDLPDPQSRVTLRDGGIVMHWARSNLEAHELLIARTRAVMRRAGFPIVFVRRFDRRTTSHQCGTARLGADPARSVVTPDLRSHEVENLWITDASVFPSSAAVNPALTVAALALRAAGGIEKALRGTS